MASSTDELTLVRDNLIYVWQGLGFLINIEKSVLQTNEKIELLGMEIDSVEITLRLPKGKKDQIVGQCQTLLEIPLITIRELTQLIGHVFQSHCNSPSTSPALCNSEATDLGVISENNINSQTALTEEVKGKLNW